MLALSASASAQSGLAQIVTGQVTVGTTATLIAAQRPRQRIILTVTSAVSCAFGGPGVTLATGLPLQPVAGATLTLETSAPVYAVCASSATIGDMELF